MNDEPLPEWVHPGPPGGWTADDLDRLPPSAPSHVELIDGTLLVMPPQTSFHSRTVRRLADAVETVAPVPWRVATRTTVRLGERQRPEPDILVVDAPPQAERTSYRPEEVVLAAEVVSEESAARDRETKPPKYARAGIRHFWRVEEERGEPVLHVHELDGTTGAYVPTGIHRDRLVVPVPFPMDIDLTTLFNR